MRHDRLRLLATVAERYYVDQLSQAEIAKETGYSRSAISRLLQEARSQGVVDIRINHPLRRSPELEARLLYEFGLRTAFVLERGGHDYAGMLRLLGRLGASVLSAELQPDSVLGISWGTAIYEVAQSLQPFDYPQLRVVQMIGAYGNSDSYVDGHALAHKIADIYGGNYFTLNAPLIVDDVATKTALVNDRRIRSVLDLALTADIALVGIGSSALERSSLYRAGCLTRNEVVSIQAAGAVGDICGTHFDARGHILDFDVSQRIVGIDIAQLSRSGCQIVAVAGGRSKAAAILGALRSGLIDILVTDSSAAEAIAVSNRDSHTLSSER